MKAKLISFKGPLNIVVDYAGPWSRDVLVWEPLLASYTSSYMKIIACYIEGNLFMCNILKWVNVISSKAWLLNKYDNTLCYP